MSDKIYLALLRGINVGGKNIIKMEKLRTCFDDMGLEDVTTYIQSGNVLFRASAKSKRALTEKIEKALSKRFDYTSRVVILSHADLRRAVEQAPKGFGDNKAKYRYDFIFLKTPLTAAKAIKAISTKDGVDTAHAGKGVLYFSRLIEKASQSRLSRIVQLPIYQNMTIRNWNTTTKLLALMDAKLEDA